MRALSIAFLVFLIALTGVAAWVYSTLPDVSLLATHFPVVRILPPNPVRRDRDRLGARRSNPGQRFEVRLSRVRPGGWVNLGSLSKEAMGAIVISEDGNFFKHDGYDVDEIKRAFQEDLKAGGFKRGASTITQQVAKNVYLTGKKSLVRKIQELAIALRLEEALTKGRILEVYMNIVELGPGIFGVGAASHYYFHKEPSELTAKEGAFLAMLLPSPLRYAQSYRDKRLTRYASRVIRNLLEKMVITGRITPEEFETQWGTPLSFESPEDPEAAAILNATSEEEDEEEESSFEEEDEDDGMRVPRPDEDTAAPSDAATGGESARRGVNSASQNR